MDCKKKSKPSSHGFGLFNWFGSSTKAASAEPASDDDDELEAGRGTVADAVPTKQRWTVEESDIRIEQSSRLVSRAMKMSNFK